MRIDLNPYPYSLNKGYMNKYKYVYAQMIEFIDNFKSLRIVKKYEGNRNVTFTCLFCFLL